MSLPEVITIKGYGIGSNCKITTYSNQNISYSFGNGRNNYCLTASYDHSDPSVIYIVQVEKAECLLDHKHNDVEEATVKLVRLALYTIYQCNPSIQRFTVRDDSHLYCNGMSGPKMSLSFDYLIKYNQTWYQRKFGAVLPGFISYENHKDSISIQIEGKQTFIHVTPNSPMDIYLKSILLLDHPCITYDEISDRFYEIKRFRIEYETARTPRDFIQTLRKKLSKTDFCMESAKWVKRYIEFIQVKIFYDLWYIPVSTINIPTHYEITEPSAKNKARILHGGKRNYTRNAKNRCGIISYCDDIHVQCVGWNDK
jgi:hypothetical protein